ncbi:MAG: hypothetical protein U9Q62_08730 [Campylobacterota bacterium]|nr:hypothetical protein [Campylobacterota bacterium]
MTAISQDFAPPFKLIAPFFVIGAIFYLLSAVFSLFFDVTTLHFLDTSVLGWVHLFLLGFVMMIIFGAMAQLVPVVLEVGHFGVEFFYVIWPLLLIGTVLMAVGFAWVPALLPYGGTVVLISMMIFVLDIYLTQRKVEKLNFAMTSVIIANIFLFLGVIVGIVLALGYAGQISVDITALLKGHVYLVIGGYIMVTIMGLSMVLLPMFGLSHHFSWRPVEIALGMMSAGVVSVLIAALFGSSFFEYLGYGLSIVSLFIYFYQITILYNTRVRKEHDIYAISLYFSYGAMVVSLLLGILYLFNGSEAALLSSGWIMFTGFFGFLITGHLYKIVPFLIWFERFSPLVGKEKVPMLADMIPNKSANAQFIFTAIGVTVAAIGLLFGSNTLFKAGVSFLIVGAIFLVQSLNYMMRFK